jgi:predicted DNA binding CopG/RHH family protein
MQKPKIKPIPSFASEAEERAFWDAADTTEYFDWSQARRVVFPNLKPSTTPISMRIPDILLAELKRLANEQDVPYQSLMKLYLAERVATERMHRRGERRPNERVQPAKARPKRGARAKAK